jgi:hypothetical protein
LLILVVDINGQGAFGKVKRGTSIKLKTEPAQQGLLLGINGIKRVKNVSKWKIKMPGKQKVLFLHCLAI